MRVAYVEVEGFRGFREKTRFDFASGFVVLSGRNGSGKSTVLDAIEFALTGSIDKFQVTSAKGGGLQDHIWWVGPGNPSGYSVSVGFIDETGATFEITRSRTKGASVSADGILRRLVRGDSLAATNLATLLQTTLIRDEKIAALSLDLTEQARFAAVRAAIGGLVGTDYSTRTADILEVARSAKVRQEQRLKENQAELGRLLGDVTEAKSTAEKAVDIADALRIVDQVIPVTDKIAGTGARLSALRKYVAERKIALREIEGARTLSESLGAEAAYLASRGAEDEQKGVTNLEQLSQERTRAEERLEAERRREQAEQESDLFASHLAALLEHGGAIGLQEGHCPLCDAARTTKQFEEALASARKRLAGRGRTLAEAETAVREARARLGAIDAQLAETRRQLGELAARREKLETGLGQVRTVYSRHRFAAAPEDPKAARTMLFGEQERLVRVERALAILESSGAVDRVAALESRVATLRSQNEIEAARLGVVERAVEAARQIDAAAKTVANEILSEQFDTVMPLLKELYRRLRPHTNWSELESDFGGKVRGSLNFVVGDGYNPQFLFSSGQRRAAGLSFLLAVHLSRPWCAWHSLLLDDPVQHIDDYRALNLVEVLASIRRTGRQVIVAVEDNALADLLCRRLRSTKGELGRLYELRIASTGTSRIASERDIYPMPHLVLKPAQAS